MEFRIKDLMIAVVPKEAELAHCFWRTRICVFPTYCRFATCFHFTCLGATCIGHTCFGHTHNCPPITFCHPFSCIGFTPCPVHTICPTHSQCPVHASICACSVLPSQCGPVSGCPGALSACPGGSVVCPGFSGDPPFVIERLEDIKVLREELNQTLKQLDELEKTGLGPQPETPEAAEALAQKLEEALKELRSQKPKKK